MRATNDRPTHAAPAAGGTRAVSALAVITLLTLGAEFSVAAPGNTAAGLAGVGAGAALGAGAGGAGATTSGAAGGGGSSAPIEVQIMTYKGLSEIAADIATLTEQSFCAPPPQEEVPPQEPASTRGPTPKGTESAQTPPVNITEAQVPSSQAQPPVTQPPIAEAKRQTPLPLLRAVAVDNIPRAGIMADGSCVQSKERSILLEDSSSALQIALYQSLLGYHDQLATLHSTLIDIFSLIIKPESLTLKGSPEQSFPIALSALDSTVLTNLKIATEGADSERFTLSSKECAEVSAANPCTVNVTFVPPTDVKTTQSYHANLKISSGSFVWNQSVLLRATYTPPKPKPHAAQGPGEVITTITAEFKLGSLASIAAASTGRTSTPAAGAAAASPLSLTYLSGIGTALSGIKAGISYSSSSAQPTAQSFQVLLENELLQKHNIKPYTSTSPLELTQAAKALGGVFADMLMWGAQLDFWNNECKPADPTKNADQDKTNKDKKQQNPECASTVVTTNLAAATQLLTGYTALLTGASDGNGNPVIADVLRGWVLSDRLQGHMDSLQVNVAAAAGSTRTNAFFLVNLFYLPKPSYNAGVIATFELRNGQNDLVRSGARTAFYDYNKNWKGTTFDAPAIKDSTHCKTEDTFCVERK